MIGDGLSHVSFGALAIAVALGITPLYFSIPVVILAAFFLLRAADSPHRNNDAAIAAMSASSLAIGILVISRTSGMTTDVDSYMFGSVLAMSWGDVALSAVLCAGVLALFIFFYHKIFCITFDENFALATGVRAKLYNLILAVVIAVIIVLAMNLVGSLLISALIIFPALSAMRVFKSFKSVTICSAILSVCCAALGMLISIAFGTPVGSTIVAVDIVTFFIFMLIGKIFGGIKQ